MAWFVSAQDQISIAQYHQGMILAHAECAKLEQVGVGSGQRWPFRNSDPAVRSLTCVLPNNVETQSLSVAVVHESVLLFQQPLLEFRHRAGSISGPVLANVRTQSDPYHHRIRHRHLAA